MSSIQQAGPPLPTRQLMSQWWRDVCFLHWRAEPRAIAPLLPRGVRPDVHDGAAWVGLVPFRMLDAGLLTGPPVPWFGTFLEHNVRTYGVDDQGRRGVVFLSLDTPRSAVVAGARAALGVRYQWARMRFRDDVDAAGARIVDYRTRRHGRTGAAPGSRVQVRYGARVAEPSQTEVFLTARFGLHTTWAGGTLWVPNTHQAWPLHRAELLGLDDELMAAAGCGDLAARAPDSVLVSPGVRTVFGMPQRVRLS